MIGLKGQARRERSRVPLGLQGAGAPALAVLTVYATAAAILFPADYDALLIGNTLQVAGFCGIMAVLFLYLEAWRRMPDAPSKAVAEVMRERGGFVALGIAIFIIGSTAFTTFKVNSPNIIPFYADPFLARIDRLIHGGEPWREVYILPEQGAVIIDLFYTRVWPAALLVGYLAAFVLLQGRQFLRYVWAMLFVYIGLGSLVALLASSVGPIFYVDFYAPTPEFTRLKEAVLANDALANVRFYTEYLLENYRSGGPAFGTGISAFPSVHVAVATLTAWLLTSQGRVWAILGWVFYAIIEYGSIYTGWHYAIGGYFSTIAVSLVWIGLSRRYGLPLMPSAAVSGAQPVLQD